MISQKITIYAIASSTSSKFKLPTYSQVIPGSACTGAHALYKRQSERYGGNTSPGPTYLNLKPIKLPGGLILPPKTRGRLLSSDGADYIVIFWEHKHSGWKIILDILTDYINRRRMDYSGGGSYRNISFGQRGGSQTKTLRIENIGMDSELDAGGGDDSETVV
jgi:nuclear pore complex protein Nup188